MTSALTNDLVVHFSGKRVLLLGGTGFVGRSLRQLLTQIGAETLFTSTTEKLNSGGSHESCAVWSVGEELSLPVCEYIIHAATPTSMSMSVGGPSKMLETNIRAAQAIVDLAKRWGNNPRLLFLSSGGVYGDMPTDLERIPEGWPVATSPLSARSSYGEGKRVAENIFSIADSEGACESIIARLFTFSGRFLPLDHHFALGNFVRDSVRNRTINIRGDGAAVRSYMDQFDMSNWLLNLLIKGERLWPYHVGSENEITILEAARRVQNRAKLGFGLDVDIQIQGQTSALDGKSRYIPSTLHTRNSMGLRYSISLDESIDQMIEDALLSPSGH